MDVMHLMKGSCDSRSPATEVLVSVKFLWDTVAVERSGFWERRKNRTRFSFTNKTTTVLTLKENATWQFSWAQGSTSRSPKLTPKKVIKLFLTSRNSRLHRHVCNWRGPLVVVTACHLVYQRHEHPQPQQGTQAVVGAIDLNGETHVSICKPTEIASCMCHLCFVDGCSLAPCGHRMCHIGHFICKKEQWSTIISTSITKYHSKNNNEVTFEGSSDPWLLALLHLPVCLVRAMCCPVQSSDLKTHSFATQNDSTLLKTTRTSKWLPFSLNTWLNSKIQRLMIMYGVWKYCKVRGCNCFAFKLQAFQMGFHATVYITRQHCFWVHSIGEKGLMELLMKRWCPNFPWKFWII